MTGTSTFRHNPSVGIEYNLLLVVHILSVVIAVGSNVTYGFWMSLAGNDRSQILFAIRGIRWIDRHVSLPAYLLAFATGVAMVLTDVWNFEQGWILISIALYIVTAIAGFTLFAPAIRRQLAEAERNPRSDEYAAAARMTAWLGFATVGIVFLIVVLMVLKPF